MIAIWRIAVARCLFVITRISSLGQNLNRSPAVGSILLRARKPFANPPFICENIKPA